MIASRHAAFRVRSSLMRSSARLFSSSVKEIKFGNEGRRALAKGIEIIANAVAITLGPKGRNVLIEQPFGSSKITKDGVTVAKSIVLKDKFENIGARIIQDVANKTNEVAGDGTTTATVLTREIFSEGMRLINQGLSIAEFRKGVKLAVDEVIKVLHEKRKIITSNQEVAQVASISANNDKHIGRLISEAMEKVGRNGVITVQEGTTLEDEVETTEGLKFDRGYISPYFVTDTRSLKVEFDKPYVLVCDSKISSIQDILPALDIVAKSRRPLLIVADDVDGEALAVCILNKIRGQVQVCAVKAPGFGDNRKAILKDISVSTGAHLFDGIEVKLDKCQEEHLGSADKITVTKDHTVFLNGAGNKSEVAEYIESINALYNNTKSEYEKEKIQERIAKLTSGIAIIKVGGSSEVEVGERKDRFIDALNATRAAVEEGIVPGGGVALLKASVHLNNLKGENFDQSLGIEAIKKAIVAPCKTIVNNSGKEGAVIAGEILRNYSPGGSSKSLEGSFNYGYDSASESFVDMIAAGIIDPVKVVKTSLLDASSTASLLATSECIVAEAPKPEPQPQMPNMGAGGMPNFM